MLFPADVVGSPRVAGDARGDEVMTTKDEYTTSRIVMHMSYPRPGSDAYRLWVEACLHPLGGYGDRVVLWYVPERRIMIVSGVSLGDDVETVTGRMVVAEGPASDVVELHTGSSGPEERIQFSSLRTAITAAIGILTTTAYEVIPESLEKIHQEHEVSLNIKNFGFK